MEQQEKKTVLNELIFIALVVAVSGLFFLATNLPNQDENSGLYSKEAGLYRKAVALEAEQARLKDAIKALENDPLYVEYNMRAKFKMKRPGEVIITKGSE